MSDLRLEEIRTRLAAIEDPVALLEGLFAFSPVAFQIYRADGHSLLVNAAFRALFGSEPPPEYNVLRDDIALGQGFIEGIRRAFAGEVVHFEPLWYDPRDLEQVKVTEGRRVAIAVTMFPLFDHDGALTHVALTCRDLTAEMRAREALEAERRRLSLILEGLPEPVVMVRGEAIDFCNDAARALFPGISPGDSVRSAVERYAPRRSDGTTYAWQDLPALRAARGERLHGEVTLDGPDGARHFLVHSVPLDDGGLSVFADITTQKASEEAVRRAYEAQEDFVSIASHELRAPITVFRASVQAALKKATDDGARTHLGRALHQTERMVRLVDDLLDVSRLDTGRLELRPTRLDLRLLAEAVVQSSRTSLGDRLTLGCAANAPIEVDVDGIRVEQILVNLVNNAAQHARDGAIEVMVSCDEAHARVAVTDHGPGIPPDELSRVFDRFFRGRERGGPSGLGLGLHIARELARNHGGDVEVRSERGRGSTFTLVLPKPRAS